jgi:hypothetical protein
MYRQLYTLAVGARNSLYVHGESDFARREVAIIIKWDRSFGQ